MKRLFPMLMLFGLLLLLAQCNSKNDNDGNGTVDTIIVRDTVYLPVEPGTSQAHVSASAAKMNVFYVGVDNPVQIRASGVSANDLRVSIRGTGASIKRVASSRFNVMVSRPGEVSINISGPGVRTSFAYRAKRIPDPVARLSKSSGGKMGVGEFKAQGGLGAYLDNFDFDAKCLVQGFTLNYIPRRQDAITVKNPGARFTSAARRLINQAKPGDIYLFTDVKARCPGDNAGRPINTLAFIIK